MALPRGNAEADDREILLPLAWAISKVTFTPPLSGPLEADPPTMSTSSILYRLYSLGTSSPDFLLHFLFRHDEEELCLTNLRGTEPARLMDSLDGVCTLPFAPHQLTKQTPQTFSLISANCNVSQ